MKYQSIALSGAFIIGLAAGASAGAADLATPMDNSGFYGGVAMRQNASDTGGMTFGAPVQPWIHLAPVVSDDTASRALVFGGYRWQNDISVEAGVSSLDKYALRPLVPGQASRGVGLTLGAGFGDVAAHSVNVDVVTSWSVYKTVALYGRMGFAQSDVAQVYGLATTSSPDPRRIRDGMNYGVGVRYDLNQSLGLRLEYGRFGRFVGDVGNGLPDTDQVSFGVQFRF